MTGIFRGFQAHADGKDHSRARQSGAGNDQMTREIRSVIRAAVLMKRKYFREQTSRSSALE